MFSLRHLLLILLASLSQFAGASSSPTHLNSAYWVDVTGEANIQKAAREEYESYENTLHKGYLGHPIWIKLEIAGTQSIQPLVLRVRPSFLSKVTLFDPDSQKDGRLIPQQSGRSTPLDSSNFQTIDLGFVITALPTTRYIYLRIDTPTSVIVDIQILPLKEALYEAKYRTLLLMFYASALLAAVIWGVFNFFVSRRGLYGLFALRQIFSTAHVILFTGLYRYISPENLGVAFNDGIYNFVLVAIIFPVILFDAQLLKEFNVRRLYRFIPLALASVTLIGIALLIDGRTTQALKLSTVISLLAMVSLLLPAFAAKSNPKEPLSNLALWLIRGGFTLTVLIGFTPVLALLGFDHGNASLHLITAHAGISTIQLMLLLYITSKQREFNLQRMLIDGQVAKSMLAQETKQRTEKESYLAMIAHELRNPLSVIRLLAGSNHHSKSIQRAATDMQNIIDRVVESEKISHQSLKTLHSRIEVDYLLSDLLARQPKIDRIKTTLLAPSSFNSDHHLITAIINNLLDNAIKYSAENSPIELSISTDTNSDRTGLNFNVKNSIGDAGLPDEAQLFKKYYRSPGAHRQIGSGLGLYLVSQWAQAIEGSITYHHHKDQSGQSYIEFNLWIPQ